MKADNLHKNEETNDNHSKITLQSQDGQTRPFQDHKTMDADTADEERAVVPFNNLESDDHSADRKLDSSPSKHTNASVPSFCYHLKSVSKITGGIIATEIFQNTLPVVDIAFIGRLPNGTEDLAAAALATVWFNLWDSTMIGFTSAVDTLLAQSYGANNRLAFRAWAGTSLIVVAMVTALLAAVLALCGPVMKLIGKDPDLAEKAGVFAYRLIPGLLPHYMFKILVKYLQAQDVLMPGIVVGLIANGFNIFFNWLLIYAWNLRIVGAPWATTLTRFVELFLLVLYLLHHKSRLLRSTWPVFHKANFTAESLRPFWKLAISGALAETAESWSFEITTILAGLVGTTALNAHAIALTIMYFVSMSFSVATGLAATIRVGQLTGHGKASDSRQSAAISVVFAVAIQLIVAAVLLPFRDWLGESFSSDEDVAHLVAVLFPIMCILMVGDAIQCAIAGILRGLGRQKLVLFLGILAYWVLAVPFGSMFTFGVDLNANSVIGLWWGMVIGAYASAILGALVLKFKVEWKVETRKALQRVTTISSARLHVSTSTMRADNAATTNAEGSEHSMGV